MAEKKPQKSKERMIKTSIDLTADQYQFLKIKALERKMRGQDPSFVTILRELIEADRKKSIIFMIVGFLCMVCSLPAMASYMPFNTNVNMNVGIGTSTPLGALTVMNGNVGIGTWVPGSALNVVGNVGIGSVAPAGSLDVSPTGTICFGSSCKTSWVGANNYWSLAGGTGNVGISTTNTVGIGTTAGIGAGLVVMNGNVGIGTWVPGGRLQVASPTTTPFLIDVNGNVGVGTVTTSNAGFVVMNGNVGIGTWAPNGSLIVQGGNVGIGTTTPPNVLYVNGTMEGNGFKLNGSNAASGAILVSNAVGIGTWMPSSTLPSAGVTNETANYVTYYSGTNSFAGSSGFQTNGTNVGIGTFSNTEALQINGNVGIGTFLSTSALVVMNGNVGIGTWAPGGALVVMNGNVGIGTWAPRGAVEINNNLVFSSIFSNGNAGANPTINWNKGSNQKIVLNSISTFAFTAPGSVARVLLEIVHDGTATAYTVTWPGTVKWPGGSAPTLTAVANAVDIICCFYDGTQYNCTDSENFS